MKTEKIYLFIDGTNLYAAQYELFGPERYLDFVKFIEEVEKNLEIKFEKVHFYASYSPKPKRPTKRDKLYLKNEALFYRSVKKTKDVIFFKGYRSRTSGKEKEVDVKLTADLVSFAFLNRYDVVSLFSGDADFLQALFNIREFCGKRIFLLCLQNKIMHKGAFHFRSYIISFGGLRVKWQRGQKIKVIKIKSPVCMHTG